MTAAIDMSGAPDPLPPTVRAALRNATALLSGAGIDGARLDAEILLAEALGCDRSKLYLHDEQPIAARALERLRSFLARRVSGEPVAYITGRREFWSRDFFVTPAVLVPRPETEVLVETVLRLLNDRERYAVPPLSLSLRNGEIPPLSLPLSKGEIKRGCEERKPKILDLGTGSGAIAVALAKEIGNAEIWATDISPDALEVARSNARRYGLEDKIRFFSGDAFMPVRDRPEFFNAIVSNPPYVRRDELEALPRDVRDFEPRVALDGGPDGLDFYRRIIPEAERYLAAAGFLVVEIGADMGEEVARLFTDAGGYAPPQLYRDLAGKQRVVCARKLT